jgi:hypothetical protein
MCVCVCKGERERERKPLNLNTMCISLCLIGFIQSREDLLRKTSLYQWKREGKFSQKMTQDMVIQTKVFTAVFLEWAFFKLWAKITKIKNILQNHERIFQLLSNWIKSLVFVNVYIALTLRSAPNTYIRKTCLLLTITSTAKGRVGMLFSFKKLQTSWNFANNKVFYRGNSW